MVSEKIKAENRIKSDFKLVNNNDTKNVFNL